VALIALFVRMRHPSAPRATAEDDRASVAVSPSPVTRPVVPPHVSSVEVLAHCQPELKETPSVPTFEVGENYNRVAVQLKVRFAVDNSVFVIL
jgi:hypothetical protein